MKRYIYLIAALLMGATSCEMTDGETREPIDVGEYIGRHTITRYMYELENFDYAIIADWYLSTEDEALRTKISNKYMAYQNSLVTMDEKGNLLIQYIYHNSWNANDNVYTYRRFITDGKLLSEGGVWSDDYGAAQNNATIRRNEDGTYSYILNNQNQVYKLTISNLKCDIQDGITYNVEGSIFHIDGDVEYPKVILDTEITETLTYIKNYSNNSRFKSGKIYIKCDDWRIDRCDEVTLTFEKRGSAIVNYLGQVGTISN